jgi:hypothetical protein
MATCESPVQIVQFKILFSFGAERKKNEKIVGGAAHIQS